MNKNNLENCFGIVRRVDELGRVVIPKQIRNSLEIFAGNEIEFLKNSSGEIVLKKFQNLESIKQILCEILNCFGNENNLLFLFDTQKLLSVSKSKYNKYLYQKINFKLNKILNFTKLTNENIIDLFNEKFKSNGFVFQFIIPLKIFGDLCGYLIVFEKNDNEHMYLPLAKIVELYLR